MREDCQRAGMSPSKERTDVFDRGPARDQRREPSSFLRNTVTIACTLVLSKNTFSKAYNTQETSIPRTTYSEAPQCQPESSNHIHHRNSYISSVQVRTLYPDLVQLRVPNLLALGLGGGRRGRKRPESPEAADQAQIAHHS